MIEGASDIRAYNQSALPPKRVKRERVERGECRRRPHLPGGLQQQLALQVHTRHGALLEEHNALLAEPEELAPLEELARLGVGELARHDVPGQSHLLQRAAGRRGRQLTQPQQPLRLQLEQALSGRQPDAVAPLGRRAVSREDPECSAASYRSVITIAKPRLSFRTQPPHAPHGLLLWISCAALEGGDVFALKGELLKAGLT